MIDPEFVTRKMVLITADLRSIEVLAGRPLEDYLASATDEVLVERYLERLIGRMIDINYHLVTEAGQPPPRDYFESFSQLARIGALPPGFTTRIAASAGLRNRLVREYDEIDPERVYQGLQAAVRDVPEYLRHVPAVSEETRTRLRAAQVRCRRRPTVVPTGFVNSAYWPRRPSALTTPTPARHAGQGGTNRTRRS